MPGVALIHTVAGLDKVFGQLCAEVMPDVPTRHTVDESLLQDTIAVGHLTDDVHARFRAHAEAARADGADLIVLTCSSVGPAADDLGDQLGVPVLRIDAAMAERAAELGRRVGVAATLPTTLEPTATLVRRAAERLGREVVVTPALADGAFAALKAGRAEEHDRTVMDVLRSLAAQSDVIVLAQASMARALAGAETVEADGRPVPVLTSPRLGVERLRAVVAGTL